MPTRRMCAALVKGSSYRLPVSKHRHWAKIRQHAPNMGLAVYCVPVIGFRARASGVRKNVDLHRLNKAHDIELLERGGNYRVSGSLQCLTMHVCSCKNIYESLFCKMI